MSLFHLKEWLDLTYSDARTMAVGQLVHNRSQIVLGTLEGLLAVLDPGQDVERRHETASLLEVQLAHPILQLLIEEFSVTVPGPLLAVLHPRLLVLFRLSNASADGDGWRLDVVAQHKLPAHAFSFAAGTFGRAERMRVCVQTLDGALHFFEGDGHVLSRVVPAQVHPGPMAYDIATDALLLSAGGRLVSVRFSSLAAGPARGQRLQTEWEVNLGDWPVAMTVVQSDVVQPSVAVLCRRSLHVFTAGGVLRYSVRLENPATAMLARARGTNISFIISTHTRTLFFYQDTRMAWAAQLAGIPVAVDVGNFGDGLTGLLVLLTDEGRLTLGYLGTEPSLFRMPVSDARFIDFAARQQELQQLEAEIARAADGPAPTDLTLSVNINMDSQSNAVDAKEPVPSASFKFRVTGEYERIDLFLDNMLTNLQVGSGPVREMFEGKMVQTFTYTTFADQRVLDHRMTVVVVGDQRETVTHSLRVPLQLICEQAATQKTASFKLSLDSSESALDVHTLFPEFASEQATGLGLRPFYTQDTVSIFVSPQTNRYRVQADNPAFCFVVVEELLTRVLVHQPSARITASAVPLQALLRPLAEYLELERTRANEEKITERLTVQMRHVEMLLLQKLKSEYEPLSSHMNLLFNNSYQRLLNAFDRLIPLDDATCETGQQPLRALINLFALLLRTVGIELPFDGSILDGTLQPLATRIGLLLPGSGPADGGTPAELARRLLTFCERGGRILDVVEETEEEEKEASVPSEPEETADTFVPLESGSVHVQGLSAFRETQ